MYLVVKQQLKHLTKEDYRNLRELSHIAKNLANEAIYCIRQHYFKQKKYLSYQEVYKILKYSENYKKLNSNMAQQILKEVDGCFKSFFGLLKLAKEGKYCFNDIKLPYYLPKDGFTTLIIGYIRVNNNKLILPYSNAYKKTHKTIEIIIPPILVDKKIKEIRIMPRFDARFFEIHYTYETECIQRKLNTNHALALDLGINNLVTGVTNKGKTFIIDGKRLKAINQWYNKENARLQSIKDKQKFGKKKTFRQKALTQDRNNKVNDYMSKTARFVINYCIANDIGTLVIGYNEAFQRKSDIGKINNQTFAHIPYGKLKDKLKYLCQLNKIVFIEQEESYTSKASFWDKDNMPVYHKDDATKYHFKGIRVKRGLYQTSKGYTFNADVNGALNILKKSRVVCLKALYSRGEVDTPVRIRVA